MFKPASQSAALPIAYVLLRLIIVLNLLIGAAILTLLVAMPTERWIMAALDLVPSPEASRIVMGLRAIAVVGLVTIPINHAILARLVAMVVTVRVGDPFVPANARRLYVIAWALLALELLGLLIGAIAKAIETAAKPLDFGGLSITGWIAVLLTFVLARVFAEGTIMRDELDGTV